MACNLLDQFEAAGGRVWLGVLRVRDGATDSEATQAVGVSLDIDGVSHDYGAFRALDDVSLHVHPGEVVALLGPSGCGKTTLLRVIAGFLKQSRGSVAVDGRRVDRLPPGRRDIGIVFQNYALFPHMTAAENVGYGLAARGERRAEIARKVSRFLGVVKMEGFADRFPRQLSGGQQQRVALARALAVEPGVLLLDEPFAALDKNLRLDMQIEIKRLQRRFGLTAVLVTHDQEEAMSIADRVAVMNGGRIEQLGPPAEVYDAPETLFVNDFIGSTNLLPGRAREDGSGGLVVALDVGADIAAPDGRGVTPGGRAVVSVRPEDLVLHAEPGPGRFSARLRLNLPLGGLSVLDLEADGGASIKLVRLRATEGPPLDGRLWCGLRPTARVSIFPAPS